MNLEDSLNVISNMYDKEKAEFSRLANYLMSSTYIMRENNKNAISGDYRFIEKNFELFSDYFSMIGWRIYKDTQYGVIYVVNNDGLNKCRLDKLTSVIMLTIRLIYEEKRVQIGTADDICTTVNEIVSKIVNDFSIYRKKPSNDDLKRSLRILESHNLIYKLGESFADYECRLVILPSVLFAVSGEKCRTICDVISEEGDNYEET